jgi:hypothetical protein
MDQTAGKRKRATKASSDEEESVDTETQEMATKRGHVYI